MIEPKNLKFYNAKRRILAFTLAGTMLGSVVGLSGCGKENTEDTNSTVCEETNEQLVISTVDIDSIGSKISFPEKTESTNKSTTPKTNTTTLVTPKTTTQTTINGKNVVTDTKNDTLVVTPEGKVVEKTQGYEVKDTTGKVIESGEGSVPQGKVWDEEQKAYVDPSQVGKYVVLETNYYDKNTKKLVLEKGILVEKANLASILVNLIPESQLYQPSNQNTYVNPTQNTYSNYNTYTEYVYSDATYYNSNGVPIIEEGKLITKEQLNYAKKNCSRVKKYNPDLEYAYSDAEYRNNDGKILIQNGERVTKDYLEYAQQNLIRIQSSNTASNVNITPNNQGTVNPNGLYNIYGMTFPSKADYDQWVIQGYTGYAEVNGVMIPENQIGSYQNLR